MQESTPERFHLIVRRSTFSIGCMATYSIDLVQKILAAYERRLGSQRAMPMCLASVLPLSSNQYVNTAPLETLLQSPTQEGKTRA